MYKSKNLSRNLEETSDILYMLKSVSLFSELPRKELAELSAHCRLIHKKKGSVIYRKEDSSNHLYIIISGSIMESVFYGSSADIIVKIRRKGEYFGEMGMLSHSSYPNTALVLEDSTLITIPQTYFLDTVWSNVCVCKVIIRELIDRLINSAENMVNTMYLDAPGRLAYTIVNLFTTQASKKEHSIHVTQSALASSCGMARQTAAKILGEWRNEGIISTERGGFRILDIDRLLTIILESEVRN